MSQKTEIDRDQIIAALELAKEMTKRGSPFLNEPTVFNILSGELSKHRHLLDDVLGAARAGRPLCRQQWPVVNALVGTLSLLNNLVGCGRTFDPENPGHADFFLGRRQIWKAANALGAWDRQPSGTGSEARKEGLGAAFGGGSSPT